MQIYTYCKYLNTKVYIFVYLFTESYVTTKYLLLTYNKRIWELFIYYGRKGNGGRGLITQTPTLATPLVTADTYVSRDQCPTAVVVHNNYRRQFTRLIYYRRKPFFVSNGRPDYANLLANAATRRRDIPIRSANT